MTRLAPLRQLRDHLRAEHVLPEVADGLDRFFDGEADLEEAFGLKPGPGQRSARTAAILAERDRLLREAAAEFFPALSKAGQARELHARWTRYRSSGWKRGEDVLDVVPAWREGTLEAHFWALLRLSDFIPAERTLRDALAASSVYSLPPPSPSWRKIPTRSRLVMFALNIQNTGLPPAAKAKLRGLQDAREAAYAVTRLAGDNLREARTRLDQLQTALTRMEGGAGSTAVVKARPQELAMAVVDRDQALEDYNARQQRYDEAGEQAQRAGAAVQNIEGWLRDLRGAVQLRPFTGTVAAEVRRGETLVEAVARTRDQIAHRQADIHRISSAPLTSIEAKAAVRREIEALAEVGEAKVGPVLEGGSIRWPNVMLGSYPSNNEAEQRVATLAPDARALVAWLMKPALLARLEAEIEAIADDASALSTAQRRNEDARVRAKASASARTRASSA